MRELIDALGDASATTRTCAPSSSRPTAPSSAPATTSPTWSSATWTACAACSRSAPSSCARCSACPQPVVARVHGDRDRRRLPARRVLRPRGRRRGGRASPRPAGGADGSATRRWSRSPAPSGRKRALEMAFTGDAIDARTALAWGLVNRVVPRERLNEETERARARRQPRQPRLEGARQARPLRHPRARRRRRLRARHRGDGVERPHRRRSRGDAVLPREARGRLSAAARASDRRRRRRSRTTARRLPAPRFRLPGARAMTNPVAYFCMEFGLYEEFPIYAGGLGILAGDFIKSAHDLALPVVGVGLRWARRLLAPAHRRGRPAGRRVPDLSPPTSSRTPACASACASLRARSRPGSGGRNAGATRPLFLLEPVATRGRVDHPPALRPDARLSRGAGDPARRRRRPGACASSASRSTPTTSTRGTRSSPASS